MKTVRFVATLVMGLSIAVGGRSSAAPASSGRYHVVMPRRALAAGESEPLRLEPPAPAGARVMFTIHDGTWGIGLMGEYRAPFLIPPGAPPIRVAASISGPGIRELTPEAEIELAPGAIPGAAGCLGPGQSFSKIMAGLDPAYVYVDELPSLTHKVEPIYPRSRFVRGVTDTVIVKLLLCKSGQVLDAVALPHYRDTSAPPIDDDPKLVEAAVTAARQWVFSPALAHGAPVACTVVIAMPFPL